MEPEFLDIWEDDSSDSDQKDLLRDSDVSN